MDGHVFALWGYQLKWKWREMEVQTWYAFAIVLKGSLVRLSWENIIIWDFGHGWIDGLTYSMLILQLINQFIWFILIVFACV